MRGEEIKAGQQGSSTKICLFGVGVGGEYQEDMNEASVADHKGHV